MNLLIYLSTIVQLDNKLHKGKDFALISAIPSMPEKSLVHGRDWVNKST